MEGTHSASASARQCCVAAILGAGLAACGASDTPPPAGGGPVVQGGYTITVRAGVTDYGSGRRGLALLAAVRDEDGAGPSAEWDAELLGSAGIVTAGAITYHAPGPGSYVAWTWPKLAVNTTEQLQLRIGPTPLDLAAVPFTAAPPATSLGIPQPRLALDGRTVQWPAVAGAAAYRCMISGQGGMAERLGTTPSCDVAALAPGSYVVQVQALSVNLAALGANTARSPALPSRFDVAEGRLGILVPDAGGTPLQLVAAAGALRFGGVAYIAVWTSITAPDGTPTGAAWSTGVRLIGGSAMDSATLMPYPAAAPRALLHGISYALRATPGDYLLIARSDAEELSVPVHLGAPAQLAEPTGVTAAGEPTGGGAVAWNTVAGATSYLVRAYDLDGFEVARGWAAAPSLGFASGTFTSGDRYDVYVLATDADMIGGAAPLQVAAAETTYPTAFTAP